MTIFGDLLRQYRRNSTDSNQGGPLSQVKLGELIGAVLNIEGPTGATISNWENGRTRLSHEDRDLLLALITIFFQHGGMTTFEEADHFLETGGYPLLTRPEIEAIRTRRLQVPMPSPPPSPLLSLARLRPYLPAVLFSDVELAPRSQWEALCRPALTRLLETAVTYLPRHLALALLSAPRPPEGQISGRFLEGTLLFADISGFTDMAENLRQQHGQEGVEGLVSIINEYLDTMLGILFKHDGRLIKFGGDAMLCLFTGEGQGVKQALWTAWAMREAMRSFAQVDILQELFWLDMKVGNSSGTLFAAQVGDASHMEYILTGSVVEHTAQAEAVAQKGDIILSQEMYALVEAWLEAEELPQAGGYFRVTAVPPEPEQAADDSWAKIQTWLADSEVNLAGIVERLEALTPYLPVGLLPQLVHQPATAPLISQHRRVTVLFANFVGMSRIIKALADEGEAEITAVIQEYFQAMQEEVHYYGGVTNKVDLYDQGDKLMVLFGAPVAHERDVRRAALTALAMQERMASLVSPLSALYLSQRIGIHTGYAFAGHVGALHRHRQEYTVMGDTVNRAARIMSHAPSDAVWVSQPVWEQVQHEFTGEPLPPIQAKGIAEPVPVFRLDQFVGEAQRPLRSLSSVMVGRDAELGRFIQLTDDIILGGEKQVIAIVGEGGVGKSRLLYEWRQQAESMYQPEDVTWLVGYAHSYGQRTHGVFIEILEAIVGFTDQDSDNERWHKLARYLRTTLPAEGISGAEKLQNQMAYCGHFLGLDVELQRGAAARIAQLEGESLQLQIRLTLCELLTHTIRSRPCVLVLEDLHWADEASLDLLQFLVDRLPDDLPLLLVLVYREHHDHPIYQTWQAITRAYPGCEQLRLRELTEDQGEGLLRNLLQTEQPLPADFQARILQETDGNPLYIEEVLHCLIEDGVLVPVDQTWELTGEVDRLVVPASLYQIIQSRIDDLDYVSPGVRRVIWLAAVLGTTFTYDALHQLFLNMGRNTTEFQQHFRTLRRADMFIHPRERRAQPTPRTYQFRHGLVQQVAYENMPATYRRQYHRDVAAWLEIQHVEALTAVYDSLAYHYQEGQIWEKAVYYHYLAGQRDARGMAFVSARRYLEQALAIASDGWPDSTLLAQIHYEYGKLLALAGEMAPAQAQLAAADEFLADFSGLETARMRARIAYELGRTYEQLSGMQNLEKALALQQVALERLTAVAQQPTTEEAMLYALAGLVYVRLRRFEAADAACAKSLTVAEATGDKWVLAFSHRLLSISNRHHGQAAKAMNHVQQSIGLDKEVGDLISLAKDYANQGVYAFEMDDWVLAETAYLQAMEVLAQVGDKYQLAMTCGNLGDLYFHFGDLERGLEYGRRSLEIFTILGAFQGIVFARVVLATLYWRQNDFDLALAELEEAQSLVNAHDIVDFQPTVSRWFFQVYVQADDLENAQAEQDRMPVDLGLETEPVALWTGLLRWQQGDAETALELLLAALARADAAGDRFQTGQCHLALARVYAAKDKATARRHAITARDIFAALGARLDLAAAEDLLQNL